MARGGTWWFACVAVVSATLLSGLPRPADACCPAPPPGRAVVNADQTVVLLWDPATRTQHFVRRASFKGDAADFGFLVPSPTQPELSESGDAAFPVLADLTAPEVRRVPRPSAGGCGIGCAREATMATAPAAVRVLEEKDVAGFRAAVLDADSADGLTGWLRANGYAHSPQVAAWAEPYVRAGWKITALKVAPPAPATRSAQTGVAAPAPPPVVSAAALRISFKTDAPLFPYREPDPEPSAKSLGASHRTLRIYFLSDGRYDGTLPLQPWTGKTAWSGKVSAADRTRLLDVLKLPATTGPSEWWLTEFEDDWPYRAAPGDLTFVRSADQSPVARPPQTVYAAATATTSQGSHGMVVLVAVGSIGLLPLVRRRWRRR
ncbi:MAG TPA: DUF2330 domain-containing protein [Humisphaera sp.]